MKRIVEWIVGILCVLIIAAVLFPAFATTGPRSHRSPCLSHLKQTAIALLIHEGDFDDRLPHRDKWMDAAFPYAKNWDVLHCPQAPKEAWGYAFNGTLSLANAVKLRSPEKVPMIYDSVNPVNNASDLVASLPAVPRHGRNNMGYADGHVKAIVAPQATQ